MAYGIDKDSIVGIKFAGQRRRREMKSTATPSSSLSRVVGGIIEYLSPSVRGSPSTPPRVPPREFLLLAVSSDKSATWEAVGDKRYRSLRSVSSSLCFPPPSRVFLRSHRPFSCPYPRKRGREEGEASRMTRKFAQPRGDVRHR